MPSAGRRSAASSPTCWPCSRRSPSSHPDWTVGSTPRGWRSSATAAAARVALLAAARLAEGDAALPAHALRALVTWSAISHFDRVSGDELRQWRETGTWTAVNARTGQRLPIGLELLHDFESNRERLDPLAAAARRRAPWLIVHGDHDETVPVDEGEALAATAAPPVEILRIAGGDHAFGAKTPFSGPNPLLIAALNATQTWLLRWLRA